jgi:hypothetical protein
MSWAYANHRDPVRRSALYAYAISALTKLTNVQGCEEVAKHAWPYAVSRDERSGYQAVVVPEFLADAGQAYVLEYASRGQTSQPGTVTVREIHGAVTDPLSLAYRITETRADPGRPEGGDGPEDGAGKTVRIFEGLVLPMPAEQVASLGLTVADLDAAASIAAPAFRKAWAVQTRVDAEPSTAICVAAADHGAPLVDPQIAGPWVVPRHRRPDDRPHEPEEASLGRGGLIVSAVVVCALAAALVWYLVRLLPESASAAVQASVQQWCSDLSSGRAGDAYGDFSGVYQHSTSLNAFESGLLGSGGSATCTSTAISAAHASLSLRRAAGGDRTVSLSWQEQGTRWRITAMKVSP